MIRSFEEFYEVDIKNTPFESGQGLKLTSYGKKFYPLRKTIFREHLVRNTICTQCAACMRNLWSC